MNHNQKTVDALLRKVTPPDFVNDQHQDALRNRINSLMASEPLVTPCVFFHVRWAKAVAVCTVIAIMAVALVLTASFFTSKSVWAQALSAMERVQTAVATFRFIPKDGVTPAPESTATQQVFMQAPDHYALIGPGRKGWFNGSEILVYDPDQNQVTQMITPTNAPGKMLDAFSSGHFPYHLFAPQYDHEFDHGIVQFEGKPLHYIELWDSKDPTDKLEFYLEPDTFLPVVQITWHRDEENAAWRQALRADYAFNVPVDPKVFVPDYPATAKVVRQELPSTTQPEKEEAQNTDWQSSALAIARHGDKYVAITDVWVGEYGWVGLKIRTNLYSGVGFLFESKKLHDFIKDPVNQQRWKANEKTLRFYIQGDPLSSDQGLTYYNYGGGARAPHSKALGDKEISRFCQLEPALPDVVYPKTLMFRILANVTDMGRGETLEHYQDWKANPDKYQLFELTVPAPAPSNVPPAGFKEWDLESWTRAEVDSQTLGSIIGATGFVGRYADAYDRYHGLPEEKLLPLGASWLTVLDNLGKDQEKRAFFEKFEPYALKKWGDKAEEQGNLALCREIMARKPKP